MYISPSFQHSLILKEVELIINDVSDFLGCAVFIVGGMKIHLLKQNNLSNSYSVFLQYNGMTQLLTTATRSALDKTTLIHYVFHNHFLDNPVCGTLDSGLIDQ